MYAYILKTLRHAFFTLFGVVTLVFILFSALPGDSARMMLGQNESSEQLAIIKRKHGFDLPLPMQYLCYLNDLSPLSAHANGRKHYTSISKQNYPYVSVFSGRDITLILKWPHLRASFQRQGKQVSEILSETFFNTFVLALISIAIAIVLGVFFGVVSALYKNRFVDRFLQLISTLGMSLPSFFAAILFAWLFGFVLHRYTGLSMTGSLYEVDDFGTGVYMHPKNLVLPAFVLGIRPLGVITQLMRSSLLDTLSKDYIRTAYAKGLSQYSVVMRHALKNSINPVVTAISGWFSGMFAGAVFVEYIFGWDGLGKEIVNALESMDLPVIMGAVLVISLVFILLNIFVDIVYAYIDPKVKAF